MECPTLDRGFYGGPLANAAYNGNHGWASYSRDYKNLTVVFARNLTMPDGGPYPDDRVGIGNKQVVSDPSHLSFSVPDTVPGVYEIKRQGKFLDMESNWLTLRNAQFLLEATSGIIVITEFSRAKGRVSGSISVTLADNNSATDTCRITHAYFSVPLRPDNAVTKALKADLFRWTFRATVTVLDPVILGVKLDVDEYDLCVVDFRETFEKQRSTATTTVLASSRGGVLHSRSRNNTELGAFAFIIEPRTDDEGFVPSGRYRVVNTFEEQDTSGATPRTNVAIFSAVALNRFGNQAGFEVNLGSPFTLDVLTPHNTTSRGTARFAGELRQMYYRDTLTSPRIRVDGEAIF